MNATFTALKARLDGKNTHIAVYDARLVQAAKQVVRTPHLMEILGVNKLIAMVALAAVADVHRFGNGRDFVAKRERILTKNIRSPRSGNSMLPGPSYDRICPTSPTIDPT